MQGYSINKIFLCIALLICARNPVLFGAQPPIFITKHAQELHDERYKAYALCSYYQKQLPEQLGLFEDVLSCVPTKTLTLTILEYIPEMAKGALHLIRSVDSGNKNSAPHPILLTRTGKPPRIIPVVGLFPGDSVPDDGLLQLMADILSNNDARLEEVMISENFDPLQPDIISAVPDQSDQSESISRCKTALQPLVALMRENYQKNTGALRSYCKKRVSEQLQFIANERRVRKEKALLAKLISPLEYAPLLLCMAASVSAGMYNAAQIIKKNQHLIKYAKNITQHKNKQRFDKRYARLSRHLNFDRYLRETIVRLMKAHACALINNIAQYCEYYYFSNPYSPDKKRWPSVTRFVSLPNLAANYILLDITSRCVLDACSSIVQQDDNRLRAKLSNYEYDDLKRTISNTIKIGIPIYLSLEGIRRQT